MKQTNSLHVLAPVNLMGVVLPCTKILSDGSESEYKFACSSGCEYYFTKDPEWEDILSQYCWEEVKVIGLLNLSNMTLIPQKIVPKGPRGVMKDRIDFSVGGTICLEFID